MSVAVFIDSNSLHRNLRKIEKPKIDYAALLSLIEKKYGEVLRKRIYISYINDDVQKFIDYLYHNGYEVKAIKVKEGTWINWECAITVDCLNVIDKVKTIVVCTDSTSLNPLFEDLRQKCVKIALFSVKENKFFNAGEFTQITEVDVLTNE